MSRLVGVLVCVTAPLVCTVLAQPANDSPAVQTTRITYAEAKEVFQQLREDLLPAELRGKPPAEIEAIWPAFLALRDGAIRARVDRGDEDSIVNLTLFGVMFTRQPRTDMREILKRIGDGRAGELIRSQPVQARLNDVVAGIASPGGNERLQFAADVAKRLGFDPATQSGRRALRTFLERSIARVFAEYESSFSASGRLAPYYARGLASDTSVLPNFAVERALEAVKAAGLLKPRRVRSAAVVGPGLDFADKREGHDFYPQQTLQPFALVDSLLRLELASKQDLRVTTFDVSPRITAHLEAARHRGGAGASYSLVLPLDGKLPWNPDLIAYWKRFGDRIGTERAVPRPPPSAGNLLVRGVRLDARTVESVDPHTLNIVVDRLDLHTRDSAFDVVIATNVLTYYDPFEQTLALLNVTRMLQPGGVFLSNDPIAVLPLVPLNEVGVTAVQYSKLPNSRDEVVWYQRQ